MRVLYDFTAESESEITVKAGQILELSRNDDSEESNKEWIEVKDPKQKEKSGFVPTNYVTSSEIEA